MYNHQTSSPTIDLMTPSSRKRRVVQVERSTGGLSPGARYYSSQVVSTGGTQEGIMRPPLSYGHSPDSTLSTRKTMSFSSNGSPRRYAGSGDADSVSLDSLTSSPLSSKSRARLSPSPSTSIATTLYKAKQTRRFLLNLFQLGPLLQLVLMFIILLMIMQSHYHATFAEQQLLRYREEESALLLQLHKIERHSIQLHKSIRTRLERAGVQVSGSGDSSYDESPLHEISKELHGQILPLQQSIQEQARANVVAEYGEGPVKLALELQFEGDKESSSNSRLDILLWPDTPHAVWTLLEQVDRHVWDGAKVHWSPDQPILEMTPSRDDPLHRGKLEFSELIPNHTNWHGAWTVGLREDPETGKLQLFMNLQDNSEYQEHETCAGRILAGFDTLQRVLSVSRHVDGDETEATPTVTIRQASAMHVTKRELGLVR